MRTAGFHGLCRLRLNYPSIAECRQINEWGRETTIFRPFFRLLLGGIAHAKTPVGVPDKSSTSPRS
jgi:hypothetical protein